MIYLELFLGFLIVGCFSFGGAYGAIPLIHDVVMQYGWLTEDMFTYFVAVSESTPGPIMVNLATYVGSSQAGFIGAVLATIAVVLPSFLVILLVVTVLDKILEHPYVKAALKGIKPCIMGIIFATGLVMIINNLGFSVQGVNLDFTALVITILLLGAVIIYKKIRKKALSPIFMIVLAAGMGIFLY